VDRMACVNLPTFPIQLLLQKHPDWRIRPVAVVDSDKPQGTILHVNERARDLRVRPGMRYAAGLSLARDLRAGVVADPEINAAVTTVCRRLDIHSPRIEPAASEDGVFWLDASGLQRLYGSLEKWAQQVRRDLQNLGFLGTVVLGFSRFATYALAKAQPDILIFNSRAEERTAAQRVRLDCLALEAKTKDLLLKLGVRTVGQFLDLPPAGIAKRFGQQAAQLHRLARGKLDLPLNPLRMRKPLSRHLVLDYPEKAIQRLTAAIEQLLEPIIQKLDKRGRRVCELKIRFLFDRVGSHTERLRPAAPTNDHRLLLDLIRLRLSSAGRLPDGVVEIKLNAGSVATVPNQNHLLEVRPKRDLEAANRALARVRADLGDDAVVRVRLQEAHLPEGQFTWEPLAKLGTAKPRVVHRICLIRRINSQPLVLTGWTRPKNMSEVQLQPTKHQRTVVRSWGPFIVSGGWWRRSVQRAYFFAENRMGEIWWVYYDRLRNLWFQQGRVE